MATETTKTETKANGNMNPKEGYVRFRDIPKNELMKMNKVTVVLEKNTTKFGISITMTAKFHDKFKKTIRNPKLLDENKYNVITYKHPALNPDENVHVLEVPIRFLQRKNTEGEILYKRFEVMFTRQAVLSDFFDETDKELMEIFKLDYDFQDDKDSTGLLEQLKNDGSYLAHFE